MPPTIEELSTNTDHERVLFCRDPEAGYRGVIAIHSSAAGRAAGGTRLWAYETEEAGVEDALRLSRGMTYKSVMAGLPLGGGKSVIFREEGHEEGSRREAVFRAHGRFVEHLGGRYVTAEDVGTSPADMAVIRRETSHVAGVAIDPSPRTALGVARAMRAAALHRWGSDDLAGRTVVIQGCGNVGFHLARELHGMGARLVVTDLDAGRVKRTVEATGARAVELEEVFGVEADVFAPCALGGILNPGTVSRLRVEIVTGAANNQLREPEDGDRLRERDILYVPDYVANAGGVIGGCAELLGWSEDIVKDRVERIYDTVLEVLRLAGEQDVPPHAAADRLVEQRLAALSRGTTEGAGEWI